jgi:hypothetical protein
MTSSRQRNANRRNAQKSTGPSSESGRASVRMNAVRHGATSGRVVLPDEDQQAFDELVTAYSDELKPEGPIEAYLVERVCADVWRLIRLEKVETAVINRQINASAIARLSEIRNSLQKVIGLCDLTSLPFQTVILNEKEHAHAEAQLADAIQKRDREDMPVAAAFEDIDCGACLERLSRYETTRERSMMRALAQLQEIQNIRRSKSCKNS